VTVGVEDAVVRSRWISSCWAAIPTRARVRKSVSSSIVPLASASRSLSAWLSALIRKICASRRSGDVADLLQHAQAMLEFYPEVGVEPVAPTGM
jgi:hypothetical protein